MRTKHYISLVVLSIVVIFGGLYLSIANPQPIQQQINEPTQEDHKEDEDIVTLFIHDVVNSAGAEFSKVKNVKIAWNIMRGGQIKTIKLEGKGSKSTTVTPAQKETIIAYFKNHGYSKNELNTETGSLIKSLGFQKNLNICYLSLEATVDDDFDESYMKISCADIVGDEENITVKEFIKNPVYDVEILVSGIVSDLGESEYPFFYLQSEDGNSNLEVWYDSMIEDDDTTWPSVDMNDVSNGDKILITGLLQKEGLYKIDGEFWMTDIEIIETRNKPTEQANLSLAYCEEQGGTLGKIIDELGSISYCLFDDGRVCEISALENDDECVSPLTDYTSENSCSNHCQDFGFDDGSCLWPKETIEGDLFIGTCLINNSRHCGEDSQCNCYCMDIATE